jgi:hypothetical protein
MDGVAWLTALKTGAIRGLVEGGSIQLGLFDERNLFELEHPDYPGERLVACRNPELAKLRAHILLCMLAYYVEWHMREAWRPLLFADEDQDAKLTRDPVAPAKRSRKALEKASTKRTADGFEAHSFRTLIDHLGGIVRNFCKRKGAADNAPADVVIETTPDPIQQRAFDLIAEIGV